AAPPSPRNALRAFTARFPQSRWKTLPRRPPGRAKCGSVHGLEIDSQRAPLGTLTDADGAGLGEAPEAQVQGPAAELGDLGRGEVGARGMGGGEGRDPAAAERVPRRV